MKIWTFWEPREKMPAYLRLCMRTWKKYLPDAEIIVVDYSSIREYIDPDVYHENLFSGYFRVDQIADALRALMLEKHGGIWLDIDTIILNRSARKYFVSDNKSDAVFFGVPSTRGVHLAFIKVPPHSRIMKYWIESAKDRIEFVMQSPPQRFFRYLGNGIVNPYVKAAPDDEVKILDRRIVMPELESLPDDFELKRHSAAYQTFYFFEHKHRRDIPADMLMLHNSWAPDIFKLMDENELMHFDCTMTNVLFEALEIDRSHIKDFLEFTNED